MLQFFLSCVLVVRGRKRLHKLLRQLLQLLLLLLSITVLSRTHLQRLFLLSQRHESLLLCHAQLRVGGLHVVLRITIAHHVNKNRRRLLLLGEELRVLFLLMRVLVSDGVHLLLAVP